MRNVPLSLFFIVTIFSPIIASQDTQPAGFTVGLAKGELIVYGSHGPQYLMRLGYWPTTWLSVGAEIAMAPKLTDAWDELTSHFNISRQNVYLGIHLRYLRHIHPYVIGTLGQAKQPDNRPYSIDGSEVKKVTYSVRPGLSVKFGLALELRRILAYFETGGGTLGTGHIETNIGFSYPLKSLPIPKSFSKGRSRISVVYSVMGIRIISKDYAGEGGIELTATNRDSGREYGLGLMILDGPIFNTGVLNMKIGWPIKRISTGSISFLQGVYGFQTLLWFEGDPDLILPAAYLSLQPSVNIGPVVAGFKLGSLATYSMNSGIFIGFTYGLVIGMSL